jgi:hypothetical protein
MKYICYSLGLIIAIATSVLAKDAPNSAEQLRNELESALKAKDTNAVLSLFNAEWGTNDWRESAYMRQMMIRLQTQAILQSGATNVSLLPLPANFQLEQTNEQNGIRTRYNVGIIGMMDVKKNADSVGQLPYGKNASGFFIAGLIQEKTPGNLLTVRVLSGPNPDSLTYTGSWIYVKSGTEIAVNVSDKTNTFKMCWGDYIKSCTIQRTSTNAENAAFPNWFHFEVSEGGTKVFTSPEMTGEEPITYERK